MSSSAGCGDFERTDEPTSCETKGWSHWNLTSSQKWWLALLVGVLFFIIASPLAYRLTSTASISLGFGPTSGPGANWGGLLLHAIIFALLVRLILW